MIQLSEIIGALVLAFLISIGVKYTVTWLLNRKAKNELRDGTDAKLITSIKDRD